MIKKDDVDKGGRPTKYTKELGREICDRLAHGESLRSICRDDEMPHRSTVIRWNYENYGEVKDENNKIVEEGFHYHYEKARNIALDIMADDLIDISDESENDFIIVENEKTGKTKEILNKEAVMRSRLRVDTRKWYLSKMAPKRYGDSRKIEHQQLDGDGEPTDAAKTEINVHSQKIADAVDREMEKVLKANTDGNPEESA